MITDSFHLIVAALHQRHTAGGVATGVSANSIAPERNQHSACRAKPCFVPAGHALGVVKEECFTTRATKRTHGLIRLTGFGLHLPYRFIVTYGFVYYVSKPSVAVCHCTFNTTTPLGGSSLVRYEGKIHQYNHSGTSHACDHKHRRTRDEMHCLLKSHTSPTYRRTRSNSRHFVPQLAASVDPWQGHVNINANSSFTVPYENHGAVDTRRKSSVSG